MYSDGRTSTPGVRVALAISRHITIGGEPLIIDPFRGPQDVLDKVNLYENQCAKVIKDAGVGNYELNT